jgi:hypothetical protein
LTFPTRSGNDASRFVHAKAAKLLPLRLKVAQAAAVTALLARGLLRGSVTMPSNARVMFVGKTLPAQRGLERSPPGALARIVPGVGALSTILDNAAHGS